MEFIIRNECASSLLPLPCVTIIITRAQYECDPLLTAVNLQSQCEIECFFFPSLSLSLSRGFHAEYTRDVAREELESPEEQREWIPMKL